MTPAEFYKAPVPCENGAIVPRFRFGVLQGVVVMYRQPRRSRAEARVPAVVPLHGRAGVIAAEEMHEFHRFFGREAVCQSNLILPVRGDVVVVLDGGPCHVGEAQLLPFVDEWRAPQGEQDGRHGFCGLFPVRALREEMIDAAGLIVVLEEDRAPAVFSGGFLRGVQGGFQLRQLPWRGMAPGFAVFQGEVHVAELKYHVENAVFTHPTGEVLRLYAVGLADGEDVPPCEDLVLEFMEEVEDARRVGRHGMNAYQAVGVVRYAVPEGRFLDVGDGVDAKAADALVQPKDCRVVERPPHFRIFPVQVRLLGREGVQVVLAAFFAPRPRAAAENAAPVGGGAAVRLRVPPDVPVGFRVRAVLL